MNFSQVEGHHALTEVYEDAPLNSFSGNSQPNTFVLHAGEKWYVEKSWVINDRFGNPLMSAFQISRLGVIQELGFYLY